MESPQWEGIVNTQPLIHCSLCGAEIGYYDRKAMVDELIFHWYCALRYKEEQIALETAIKAARNNGVDIE